MPPTPVFSVTTPWSAGSVARSRFAKVCENPTFDSPYSGTCDGANVPGLQRPPAQAAATAPVVAAGTVLSAVPASDPAEALQKIGKLRDDGVITEDEFQAKKSELLARM